MKRLLAFIAISSFLSIQCDVWQLIQAREELINNSFISAATVFRQALVKKGFYQKLSAQEKVYNFTKRINTDAYPRGFFVPKKGEVVFQTKKKLIDIPYADYISQYPSYIQREYKPERTQEYGLTITLEIRQLPTPAETILYEISAELVHSNTPFQRSIQKQEEGQE